MAAARVTLAPSIASLASLGASSPEALLGLAALDDEARVEPLDRGPGWERLRVPLPGTPSVDGGPLTASPRGAGTGHVHLLRFSHPPRRRVLAARLTHPRSASLAERRWNLLCTLRAAGVVTPEPLAVVSEAASIAARRSALVWREPDPGEGLVEALARRTGRGRGLVLDALGRFLAHLAASGVAPARLDPTRLRVLGEGGTQPESANDACGLDRILAARRGPRPAPVAGMSWRELPEVLLADPPEGGIDRGPASARVRGWLRAWSALPDAVDLSRADRLRVLRAAWPADAAHDLRRAARGH